MRATDRAPGIRNYVENWAEVEAGENVILVADSYANEDMVNEVAAEARAMGADVVVSWIDFNPIQAQGGGPIIDEALTAADKMLRMTFATSHDRGTQKAIMEHGLQMYSVANPHDPEFFVQEAFRVQKHRLVITALDGFPQGQHGVDVLSVGLGLTHRNIDMMTGVGRGSNTDALLYPFVTQVGGPFPGGDHHVGLQAVGP